MATVTHLIGAAVRGGATRSVLTAAVAGSALGEHHHEVISLRESDEEFGPRFEAAGIPLLAAPEPGIVRARLAEADIVHVHYWNSPELLEVLRGRLPAMRMLIWCHVGGDSDPQRLAPELVELADMTVASTRYTARLPELSAYNLPVIEPITEAGRFGELSSQAGSGPTVGYIGTVDPVKMHPDFVSLCLGVDSADARFVVCGSGGGFGELERLARQAGAAERFDLRGYVAEPGAIFAELDVFGYPLCRGNYSASELVLQEAMHAGVPPVVLPYGAAAATVDNGVNGIVASDENAYCEAVRALLDDDALRSRLGETARRRAAERWSPAGSAAAWSEAYAELLERPKRVPVWPGIKPGSGADAFVAPLGAAAEAFWISGGGGDDIERALAADNRIADLAAPIGWAPGGVLDYRRRHPGDAHLRLWAGILLAARGRRALAAGEFAGALRAGCDPRRVEPRLEAITASPPAAV